MRSSANMDSPMLSCRAKLSSAWPGIYLGWLLIALAATSGCRSAQPTWLAQLGTSLSLPSAAASEPTDTATDIVSQQATSATPPRSARPSPHDLTEAFSRMREPIAPLANFEETVEAIPDLEAPLDGQNSNQVVPTSTAPSEVSQAVFQVESEPLPAPDRAPSREAQSPSLPLPSFQNPPNENSMPHRGTPLRGPQTLREQSVGGPGSSSARLHNVLRNPGHGSTDTAPTQPPATPPVATPPLYLEHGPNFMGTQIAAGRPRTATEFALEMQAENNQLKAQLAQMATAQAQYQQDISNYRELVRQLQDQLETTRKEWQAASQRALDWEKKYVQLGESVQQSALRRQRKIDQLTSAIEMLEAMIDENQSLPTPPANPSG